MPLLYIIKLLFQSEFAGEHIIKNSSQTYNHLKQECQNLNNKTYQIEPIGNNLVRFHLFISDLTNNNLLISNNIG